MSKTDQRLAQLNAWLQGPLKMAGYEIAPASADASFRRYFRVSLEGRSLIVMDAPPGKEDCRPFITIAAALLQYGMNVPQILEQDLEQGFLLLTDLGERQYLPELNDDSADRLYKDALDALVSLQSRAPVEGAPIPPYDRQRLVDEMALCQDWFLKQLLGLELDKDGQEVLDGAIELLAANALGQTQVWVHRDYHSRNLMVTAEHNPGVLDFQDAVVGPLTYDLVSLLRDCYIAWPQPRIDAWVEYYWQQAGAAGIAVGELVALQKDFDLMGVQRHLKVLGIFSRLNLRDGKAGYLKDIPLVMRYVLEVAARHEELRPLHDLMADRVRPAMAQSPYFE